MERKLLKPIYECRCNGRLQTKRFTRLAHTGSVVELEHQKIKTRWLATSSLSFGGICLRCSYVKLRTESLPMHPASANTHQHQVTGSVLLLQSFLHRQSHRRNDRRCLAVGDVACICKIFFLFLKKMCSEKKNAQHSYENR